MQWLRWLGFLEPINFWPMGSGTHQFWKERTIIRPLFSLKQARNRGWEFRNLNQQFGTHQFEILTEPLICNTMVDNLINITLYKGWIAKPVDESLDLKQLQLNGALEKLINDLRVMELSGKDIPKLITIRLDWWAWKITFLLKDRHA